jgi:prolipoprotein diacylglyceryltransferase
MRADLAGLLAPSWFTCVGLAGLAALILMLVLARRRGVDPGTVASAVLWGYVAAVIAGIAVPAAITATEHLAATGQFQLRWSGMTSFWGYLAGATALVLVCRRDGVSVARMADLAVIPLGIALAFARLGCFMAGCDYGKVSSLPWAVRFPAGSPAWRDHVHAGLIPADRAASLPVHPTELYEAALGLVIVAVAILVGLGIAAGRRPRKDGALFMLAAATYAIGRLAIEALRGDAGRGIYAGLSSGQIFSLLVLLAIAARTIAGKRHALTAAVAAALALTVAYPGHAEAQPGNPPLKPEAQPGNPSLEPEAQPGNPSLEPEAQPGNPSLEPKAQPGNPSLEPEAQPGNPPLEPEAQPGNRPLDSETLPPEDPAFAPPPIPAGRPMFSAGVLLGVATPLNRRPAQIATLGGTSLSIGFQPGRFGVWLDLDALSSAEASHDTVLVAVGFTLRPTSRLTLGARSGIGATLVNFKDPAFRDVGSATFRLDAIAEYAFLRHWALWVRPLTVDLLNASDLGGPITTYQFRIGVAYRFGPSSRGARPAIPPPFLPPPPPPLPPPPPEIGAAP